MNLLKDIGSATDHAKEAGEKREKTIFQLSAIDRILRR